MSDKMRFSTNMYGNYMFRESIRQANDSSEMNNCATRGEPISAEIAPSCDNEQRPRTYRVFGIEPKLVFRHDLFGVESETTTGIRGPFEWADRERYVGNAGPRDLTRVEGLNNHGRDRYQNNSLDTQALCFFAQNRFFLGDFTVTPGIRIEHYEQENTNEAIGASESYSRTEPLPGVGATYNGIDNVTLFAGVHRGFAPARIDDVTDPEDGLLRQVNPEMSLNYEAGVRTSPIPGISAEITYFRIDFESEYANGEFVKIELEDEKGVDIYELGIKSADGSKWEFKCDKTSGKIIEKEQELPSSDHPAFAALKKIDEAQARKIALEKYPGNIDEVEYEIETDGTATYEFEIKMADGREMEVEVDAVTGKIVKAEED